MVSLSPTTIHLVGVIIETERSAGKPVARYEDQFAPPSVVHWIAPRLVVGV